MLDGQKFLRELPVLHGKIEMPDYNGVCTGVYLICEKGMGFISIFCTNERKENAIFGYDVLRNKGTFLSLHQIEILKCKIGKEQDSELHFNKGVAFDDIHDVVERNKDNLKDKGIIAIKGTKIFYDVYADMVSMSIKMIINENEYVIDEIVGVLFEDFSCKFTIHEMQLDEKIQKVSLQTDIELIINIAGIEYREKGIIFKIDKSNKQYTLKLMSYPMYMLGHMVINNLVFQNIRNPFVIIKYMLESVDIDINGVAVPNEMKAERTFLVAMAINNLKLLTGISLVTKYILDHFDQKTYRGDKSYEFNLLTNVAEVASAQRGAVDEIKQKQRVSGFNSIFCVASVPMAKLYYQEFKKQMAADPTKRLRIATIYSYGANEAETDGILDEENPEDTSNLDQSSRDFLDAAIQDYNEMFHTNY